MVYFWKAILWTFPRCFRLLFITRLQSLSLSQLSAKMKLAFLTLWSLLHITSQNPTNFWTLKDNVLVLEVTGEVGRHPLSCFHSAEDAQRTEHNGGIFWRKDGVKIQSSGNRHIVALWESFGGGNYSCHNKDGSLLNHTTVLILEDQTKRKKILTPDSLKCSASNYSGTFHCSWNWHPSRIGNVALIQVWRPSHSHDLHCTEDSGGGQWTCLSGRSTISCSVDLSGNSISCTDTQHCPYAEEVQAIQITIYVANDFLLENYSKRFYLSEIVKPGKVQITKINKTAIEWMYPSSWDSPSSYFPLTFQVAQLRRRKACDSVKSRKIVTVNCTDNCSSMIKRNTLTVCFRAKDALSNSEWSEWSSERIKSKKKIGLIRNTY